MGHALNLKNKSHSVDLTSFLKKDKLGLPEYSDKLTSNTDNFNKKKKKKSQK